MKPSWMTGCMSLGLGVVMAVGVVGAAKRLEVGERPPQFTATDLSGKTHNVSAYRGRVVVLHFWASWCPFCRRSIPSLVELYKKHAPHGMQLLAISTDQSEEMLRAFIQEQHVPYPVIQSREVALQYHIEGIPVTVVVDREGLVQFVQEGAGDEFISVVERLMGS